jgi:hypothetical protein
MSFLSSSSSSSSSVPQESSTTISKLKYNLLGEKHVWCILNTPVLKLLTRHVIALVKIILKSKEGDVLRTEFEYFDFPNIATLTKFSQEFLDFHDDVMNEFNNERKWFDKRHNQKEVLTGTVEKQVDEEEKEDIPVAKLSTIFVVGDLMKCRAGFYELEVRPEGKKENLEILMFIPSIMVSNTLPSDGAIENFVQKAYKQYATKKLLTEEDGGDSGDLPTVLQGRQGGMTVDEFLFSRCDLHRLARWMAKPCLIYHAETEDEEKVEKIAESRDIEKHNQEEKFRCNACGKMKLVKK